MGVVLLCAYSLSLLGRNTYVIIRLRRSQSFTRNKLCVEGDALSTFSF